MKNLIIYFSHQGENYYRSKIKILEKGNSERLALMISNYLETEVFRVIKKEAYPCVYKECVELAKEEYFKKERPELKSYLKDVSEYENIFLIGPCWIGTYPMAMFSQLERLDLSKANIYALITHEGSGLGNLEYTLKEYCKDINIKDMLAINGSYVDESKEEVEKFLIKNKLLIK